MRQTGAGAEHVFRLLDQQLQAGRFPGYAAALRIGGETAVRAAGRTAVDPDSPPMREDTLFRIASITKPMGGALVLGLVEDGVLALDDPIARWLPEAAHPRVLLDPRGPLDRTTEADRPITVRDLLTCTSGWGVVMDRSPLQAAMLERQVFPGALPPPLTADEYVERLTSLPLQFQPGEGWAYDSGIDLAGVLVARAAGKPLSELFGERVTGPLGMRSTAFTAVDPGRLATAYRPGPDGLELLDPPDGAYVEAGRLEKLSGGLVSCVADVLRFYTTLADDGAPLLSPDSLARMTADALTPQQREMARLFVGPGGSWGLAVGVDVEAAEPWMAPGRYGWTGGTGTTAYVDPVRDTVCVLLTQRAMAGPDDGFEAFWTAVAEAGTP